LLGTITDGPQRNTWKRLKRIVRDCPLPQGQQDLGIIHCRVSKDGSKLDLILKTGQFHRFVMLSSSSWPQQEGALGVGRISILLRPGPLGSLFLYRNGFYFPKIPLFVILLQ
jgi:hypothetical protein